MKKILLLAAAMLAMLPTWGKEDRSQVLKVYNWADYIDENVLAEFPAWYKEQTGEDIRVIYQLFDINEIMLSKIERGHEDFDVVCPSDYIIERMLRNDMLLPISRDFGETPDYTKGISPYIIECFNKIDGSGKNANDYAIGYMWGTTGFLFNPKYVTREQASTWNVLSNEDLAGKIFVKDAFRDVYSPLLVYLRQDELKAGTVTQEELMYDASDESIALVEEYMKNVKHLIAGWEADFGKELMTKEKGWLNLSWSGDAKWAIDEAARIGVTLDYVVPMEGSNVWFDGWVIPKYAKNIKAATYFINYMCRSDVALRNMEAIGYVSTIATPEVLAAKIDSTVSETYNLNYFFGPEAQCIPIDPTQYPDSAVIARCTMMHDSGDRTEALLAMWSRIKGDNATNFTFVVLAAAVAVWVIFEITRKNKKKHRRK